jgi:anti-anti-sigma factor
MVITQNEKDGILRMSIAGRLDAVSAVEADREFNKVFDEGGDKLLVNLKELEYISSAGLRVLLVVAKRMQQKGGKVCLCCLADNVKEVFEISGFSSIFKIFESEEESAGFFED